MADEADRTDLPMEESIDEGSCSANEALGADDATTEDTLLEDEGPQHSKEPQVVVKFTYSEHADTAARTDEEIEEILGKLKLEGSDVPRPVLKLEETGLPDELVSKLKDIFGSQLGPFASYGLPSLLSGRDHVSLGDASMSERVLSFLPHVVAHCQRNMKGDCKGPIAMVVASSCRQVRDIYKYFRDAGRPFDLECLEISEETSNDRDDFQSEFHVAIGTLTVLQKVHASNYFPFSTISCVVLYGVDDLLDLGFETPLEQIVRDTHPERQLVALSRTWLPDASRLVASLASNPIMARLGEVDTAALPSGVAVNVHVVSDESNKKAELQTLLEETFRKDANSKTLVLVKTKRKVRNTQKWVDHKDYPAGALIAGRGKAKTSERDSVMKDFRSGKLKLLVATAATLKDVGREEVKYLVVYDFPAAPGDFARLLRQHASQLKVKEVHALFTNFLGHHAQEVIDLLRSSQLEPSDKLVSLAQWAKAAAEGTGPPLPTNKLGGPKGEGAGPDDEGADDDAEDSESSEEEEDRHHHHHSSGSHRDRDRDRERRRSYSRSRSRSRSSDEDYGRSSKRSRRSGGGSGGGGGGGGSSRWGPPVDDDRDRDRGHRRERGGGGYGGRGGRGGGGGFRGGRGGYRDGGRDGGRDDDDGGGYRGRSFGDRGGRGFGRGGRGFGDRGGRGGFGDRGGRGFGDRGGRGGFDRGGRGGGFGDRGGRGGGFRDRDGGYGDRGRGRGGGGGYGGDRDRDRDRDRSSSYGDRSNGGGGGGRYEDGGGSRYQGGRGGGRGGGEGGRSHDGGGYGGRPQYNDHQQGNNYEQGGGREGYSRGQQQSYGQGQGGGGGGGGGRGGYSWQQQQQQQQQGGQAQPPPQSAQPAQASNTGYYTSYPQTASKPQPAAGNYPKQYGAAAGQTQGGAAYSSYAQNAYAGGAQQEQPKTAAYTSYPQQYQGAASGAGQQGYQSGGAAANAGSQGFGAAANVGSQGFGSAANQGYSTSYPTTAYQTAGATAAQKPAAANPQAAPAYATAQGQYNSYGGQFAGAGGATSQYYRSGNQ